MSQPQDPSSASTAAESPGTAAPAAESSGASSDDGKNPTVVGGKRARKRPRGGSQASGTSSATEPGKPGEPSDDAESRTLQLGEVVAGRFRILRFIAEGGMGEVYEAEDLELRDRVALKTVLPEMAKHPTVLSRFNREIQLARKVTHPNVSRIFDIFHHQREWPRGSGRHEKVTFLTMEFLAGETLAERLLKQKQLSPSEALPIVEQMAAALSAAHEAGIVHRDFKSPNVILVPSQKKEGGVRAVVTDFGLACATEGDGQALVHGAGLAGTPAYMAPEQVEGKPITFATDLYALGVVMYEMIGGKRPFSGGTDSQVAARRLTTPPPPLRELVAGLDPRWEATISRCLEVDPSKRFASAAEVARSLGGEDLTHQRRLPKPRGSSRWLVIGALGVALIGSAVGVYPHLFPRPTARPDGDERPALTQRKMRRSVAVLGFKNLAARPDAAWLSTALSEMLATELGAAERLRIVSGENVARMKLELALTDSESLARDTLTKVRQNLGCDLVVLGSYLVLAPSDAATGGTLRLDLRVQETSAGETVVRIAETGTEAQLLELVGRLGSRLRGGLGLAELSAAEEGGARASRLRNPDAARLYSEGLSKLRLFDARVARELLEKAVAAEPLHPFPHAALAEAFLALGYEARAQEEAKKAFELSPKLSRQERLSVEGRYHETRRAWEQAVDVYRALFSFYRDDLDYGLRLAAAQTAAGKGDDALLTLDTLRKLPPPAGEDVRLDIAEAEAAESRSNFKRQQSAAERAAQTGTAKGARLLVARARLVEGKALYRLTEWQRARNAVEEARQIWEIAGDRGGVASALNIVGSTYSSEGDYTRAKKAYFEALRLRREIGDTSGVAATLNNLGLVLAHQANLRGAKQMFEEVLTLKRQLADRTLGAHALNNLGNVLTAEGDLDGARRLFGEAAAFCREVGNRYGLIYSLIGLAEVHHAEGDLAQARKLHDEALAMQVETGGRFRLPESYAALAMLSLEQGRASEAEAGARRAIAEAAQDKTRHSQGVAEALLARALFAVGKRQEAEQMAERAAALAAETEAFDTRLFASIGVARVQVLGGKTRDAIASLESLLHEAVTVGHVPLELEARLALGEARLRAGQAAGRTELLALMRDASSKGFRRISTSARALAR